MCPLGAALAIPGRVRMFGWLRRWPECGSPLGADIDLVPTAEIADIKDSSLSTPYNAWALAARYRQRAFVFWTYVSALAEDPLVRVNILSDPNRMHPLTKSLANFLKIWVLFTLFACPLRIIK